MMYGTDNGAPCACGGTVKRYDVEPQAGDMRIVSVTCISCGGRGMMAIDGRIEVTAANLSREERRRRKRVTRPRFECPSGYGCVTAGECSHWDYEG